MIGALHSESLESYFGRSLGKGLALLQRGCRFILERERERERETERERTCQHLLFCLIDKLGLYSKAAKRKGEKRKKTCNDQTEHRYLSVILFHHHQIVLTAWTPLTPFRYPSLLSVAPGKYTRLRPVRNLACWLTLVRPYLSSFLHPCSVKRVWFVLLGWFVRWESSSHTAVAL